MDFPNKPLIAIPKPVEQPSPTDDFESVMPLPPQTIARTEINPDNPNWNILPALAVWIGSVLLLILLSIVFGGIYMAVYALNHSTDLTYPDLVKIMPQDAGFVFWSVASVIPAHLLTILLVWMVVTNLGKRPFFKSLGWNWWKDKDFGTNGTILCVAACFVVTFLLLGIGGAIVSHYGEQETALMRMLKTSRYVVYLTAFMATFTAPFVEEIVYRGVLYSAFQKHLGKFGGILVVTFLFAAVHVPQYLESLPVIFIICLLSLILTTIRAVTENLLACVVIHTIFNGVQSIGLIMSPEELEKKIQTEVFIRFLEIFR